MIYCGVLFAVSPNPTLRVGTALRWPRQTISFTLRCQNSSSAISSASVLNYAVVSEYGLVLIQKLTSQYSFNIKKKIQGVEGAHLSEPQKTHPTSQFTIVA